MTIFEMLEKLETEIVSLRTRYMDLARSPDQARPNGNGRPAAAPKKPSARGKTTRPNAKAKRKKALKAARPAKGPAFQQLELPVAESAAAEEPARVLGKRQALGKSLVQLRKMSAWRTGRSPEE